MRLGTGIAIALAASGTIALAGSQGCRSGDAPPAASNATTARETEAEGFGQPRADRAVGPNPPLQVPAVRLLDGRASETLRRTYANVAGENPTPEALAREAAWIDSVSRPLRAFWDAHGERVLVDLADYTGTAWVESSINVYLIRRNVGLAAFSLPVVLDLSPFERVPAEHAELYYGLLEWALVHELVHRGRDQPWIARSRSGSEEADPAVLRIAGSAHDWDDVVTAFVMRDVLGDRALHPLLFNRALQRTLGVYRLDRIERDVLARWRPSRTRPLAAWLRGSGEVDTGFHHAAAERRLAQELAGAGAASGTRVRAAAARLADEFGLAPEEVAQLLSDWEGVHGAGRLRDFPYRSAAGGWEWQETR